MRYISANYIFPIASPPIKNGVVVIDDEGKIISVEAQSTINNQQSTIEYFNGIICPGFVNTHCHIELSYLKGAISEKKGLDEFIREIETVRRNFSEQKIINVIEKAEQEMIKNGIVAVGDICNSDVSFKQKQKNNLKYHSFIELYGFHPDRAEAAFEKGIELHLKSRILNLKSSITPHAPYSASEKLLEMISVFAEKNNSILSFHNQENEDENLMFEKKEGKIIERLKAFGIDISFWKPTGKNSTEYVLSRLPKHLKKLLVHNTFLSKPEISDLKSNISNLYFCLCPNANLYIENKLPDVNLFVEENLQITIGTDSLASNWSLSILDELKTIHQHFPKIELNELLTWATKNGADFLNFSDELGTIEKGKKPGLNFIENIDLENLKITSQSSVWKIA